MAWLTGTPPAGWMICDGTGKSRTDHAALFAVIRTRFGAGNGSTTFNVPDLRSRFGVGCDSRNARYSTLGQRGGSSEVNLAAGNLPPHQHGGETSTNGDHSHTGGTTGAAGSHTHKTSAPGSKTGRVWGDGAGWYENSGTMWWGTTSQTDTQSGTPANHTHTLTTTSQWGQHTHTSVSTDDGKGTGAAVSIANPFVTVNFIIRAE